MSGVPSGKLSPVPNSFKSFLKSKHWVKAWASPNSCRDFSCLRKTLSLSVGTQKHSLQHQDSATTTICPWPSLSHTPLKNFHPFPSFTTILSTACHSHPPTLPRLQSFLLFTLQQFLLCFRPSISVRVGKRLPAPSLLLLE